MLTKEIEAMVQSIIERKARDYLKALPDAEIKAAIEKRIAEWTKSSLNKSSRINLQMDAAVEKALGNLSFTDTHIE